ncbi:MAG: glycosyltransferase family 4 protein [Agrococcus sp.]
MLRVAHIDHTVEPGGAEIALRRLLEGEPGWHARVFVPPSEHGLGEYAALGAGPVHVVGVPQRAGAAAATPGAMLGMLGGVLVQAVALRMSRDFRRSGVVHANTSRAALIGALATAGSRRRLVVHLRDAVDAGALGRQGARAMRFALRRADGVIANSRYTLRSAERWIRDGAGVAVIPSTTGHDGTRARAPLRDAVRTVGILARLTPWKGQAEVIRAFAEAFPGSDVRLQIAGSAAFGEAAFEHDLRRLVTELGVADRVDFLGQVGDIWPLVDGWDVCVQASTRPEPLGQNVLQYLAAARPTIVAGAGGPLEWVEDGETGLVVAMGDERGLARAMRRLADDAGLRQRLHRTLVERRPVRPDADIVGAHAELFSSVAAGRRPGS